MLALVMSVINTGGVIRGGGGRGVVLAVISTGDAITTVLADIFFPTPSIVAFRDFTVSFFNVCCCCGCSVSHKKCGIRKGCNCGDLSSVHFIGRLNENIWCRRSFLESMGASDESLSSDPSLDK